MSKIGVAIKIDVTKIDKALMYKGEKGTYLNCTVFVDDNADQYGNNGMITQDVSKEARAAGERGPILGNVKIIWRDNAQQDYRGDHGKWSQEGGHQPHYSQQPPADDIPF